MVRYYFDVHSGATLLRDDDGCEFEDLEAAIQGAARSAAEIGTDQLARGDLTDVVIEIRDEQHRRVLTVTASMRVDRHTPLSQDTAP